MTVIEVMTGKEKGRGKGELQVTNTVRTGWARLTAPKEL
jgi:hypothetical protein